jgi:hypothetical protein
VIELLTTFGRLNSGDRVRLSGERETRKVQSALPYPFDFPGGLDVRVSFLGGSAVIEKKKELVWLVLSPG